MSRRFRLVLDKVAYTLFLLFGFAGVGYQLKELFNGRLELTLSQVGLTVVFAVFIFRPKILLEAFDVIINKFKNKKDA